MNIALIGSGGREHAICRKLVETGKKNKIFCIPGNAGTERIATNLNVDFLNFKLLLKTIKFLSFPLPRNLAQGYQKYYNSFSSFPPWSYNF